MKPNATRDGFYASIPFNFTVFIWWLGDLNVVLAHPSTGAVVDWLFSRPAFIMALLWLYFAYLFRVQQIGELEYSLKKEREFSKTLCARKAVGIDAS